MRFVIRVAIAAVVLGTPAVAVAAPSASTEVEVVPWAWLQVDLELSRQLLGERDLPAAGQLALQTHKALSAAAAKVALERGQDYVDGLHRDLSEVLRAAGFAVPEAPAVGEALQVVSRR